MKPIPTRRWYLSAPLCWYLAGVAGLVIGASVYAFAPELALQLKEYFP